MAYSAFLVLKWYHPLTLSLLPRINNRTHRESIVSDGRIGFIGEAGIFEHWRNRTFFRVYEWAGGLLEHQE